MRQAILAATRRVFARVGSHELSVERVLAEARLSRPTFYRYFRSVDAALDRVLRDANDELIAAVRAAVEREQAPGGKVEASVLAWRDWGAELGPMLRAMSAELHDVRSPVHRHRRRAMRILSETIVQAIEAMGRRRPSPLVLDALIHGLEYLGYRYHLGSARDAQSWQQTRAAMARLAFGLLASEEELAIGLPLLRALDAV